MGFKAPGFRGNKKKGSSSAADESEKKQEAVVPARKGRVEEPLLFETVWETTVDACRGNPLFCVTRNQEEFFVGLYMPFSEIGGLTKKESKKSETKGSIVTSINHGTITVISNPKLNEKEAVVFIPTRSSLMQMAEYTLLADTAKYQYCFINSDSGELELTNVTTDFKSVMALVEDGLSVATVPGIHRMIDDPEATIMKSQSRVAKARNAAADSLDKSEPEEQEALESESDYSDSDGYTDEGEFDNGELDADADQFSNEPSVNDETDGDVDDGEGLGSKDDVPYGDQPVPDLSVPIPEDELPPELEPQPVSVEFQPEQTIEAISRKFFDPDIATSLSSAPLDQALSDLIPFRPVQMMGTGWLHEQVNVQISNLNSELHQMHVDNLAAVRKHYINMMAEYYVAAAEDVRRFDTTETYTNAYDTLMQTLEDSSKIVEEQRELLREEFDMKAKEAGETAAADAEQHFRSRYEWELNQKLRNVEIDVETKIRAQFDSFVGTEKAKLRQKADIELDEKNKVLVNECCDMYAKLVEQENDLRKKREAEMMEFMEANRKDEVARIAVLSEEQSRDDRVARMHTEYDGQVMQLKKQFDALGEAHEANIRMLNQRHEDELAAQENIHRRDIAVYASDNQRQQARIDELTKALSHMDEAKKAEYAAKIAELESQRDAGEAKYKELVGSQRKGNHMAITIGILSIVLSLLIGLGVGYLLFSGILDRNAKIDAMLENPAVTDVVTPPSKEDDDIRAVVDGLNGANKSNPTQADSEPTHSESNTETQAE